VHIENNSVVKQKSLFRRYWPVGLIIAAGLTASSGIGAKLHRQAVEVDRARLRRIGDSLRDALKLRIQTTDLYLRHGEDYFGSQEVITEPMFREWCMKYGWSINTRGSMEWHIILTRTPAPGAEKCTPTQRPGRKVTSNY